MSETTERVFSSLSGLEGGSDRTGNGRAERTDLDLVRRDERAYPDPDRFDIDRKQQIALGFGIHSCPGAALARLESRIAFEEFRARYPCYRVDERGLRRVHMANVAGFSHVPVAVDGRA
jgi:cytochrome P450